jgi:cbb3-type cytochrome oxidase subunit 3
MSANPTPTSPSNMPTDPLDKLKDIHLPDAVSWWPLAPGWWILLVLFLLMIAIAIYLYIRSQRKSRQEIIIEQALQLFDSLQEQSLNPKALIMELSKLLRRTAISLYGRGKVANLAGQHWLLFLNDYGSTKAFTEGVGQALADQPYRPEVDYHRQALLGLTHDWLKKQLLKAMEKK